MTFPMCLNDSPFILYNGLKSRINKQTKDVMLEIIDF